MMNRIIIAAIISILPFLIANRCSEKKEKNKQVKVQQAIIDKSFDYSANLSNYVIKEAVLKDSILTLTIEANICENDLVELVFNGNYLKSLPPKAQLGLRFTENYNCKKNTTTRSYNVSNVKYTGNKTTILLLNGKEPISY
jgi:hypothetical protein